MNSAPIGARTGPGFDVGRTTLATALGDEACAPMLDDAMKSPSSKTARLWSPCPELSAVSLT
jgi:hypothetical protein